MSMEIKEISDKTFRELVASNDDLSILTHKLNSLDLSNIENLENVNYFTLLHSVIGKDSNNRVSEQLIEQFWRYISQVPFPSPIKEKFTFIDLFAGVGGFRLALQNVGGKCVFSSEWNEDAKLTYWENFGEIPYGDITLSKTKDVIPENFDILCAGFPCQAFSIAGQQKGFADTRGTLFFEIEQIVQAHRPKVVLLENVKNLVSHDKGKTFKIIINTLEEKLGYQTFAKVLNTATHANIPQNRERIFIVGFDKSVDIDYSDFSFPDLLPLSKSIHDIIDHEKQHDFYYYKPDHPYFNILSTEVKSKDTIYQWRRVYVRENKNNLCPTLTANMGLGGHNVPIIIDDYGIRKLTEKECFAFQGFPTDKFQLPKIAKSKLYLQAGNSVTTPLIERIAKSILEVL